MTLPTAIKIPHFVADERGKYRSRAALTEAQIIKAAKAILKNHACRGTPMTNPERTRAWLQMQYMDLEHEVFACLFMDNQHCVITHEVLFRGTINATSVYSREIVKRALQLNAAAVIFAHNHPSGVLIPSKADKFITDRLKEALNLIDVRTIDHFIVSKAGAYSFAEHSLI
jgi:DNA repair protein RadC